MGDLGDLPFDTATISTFLLVLCRTSAWAITAPLVGARVMSKVARLGLGIGLAGLVTPMVNGHQPVPQDLPGYAGAVVAQVLIGLVLGFLTGVLLSSIEMAGSLADVASGFSFGSQLDPVNNSQSAVFARMLNMTGLALLAATDGLSTIVAGFVRTFFAMPLSSSPGLNLAGAAGIGHLLSSTMVAAIEIAAPVLGALFVTDAGLGLVARIVPQSNILAVAFSIKALVTFGAFGTMLILLPAQHESLIGPSEKAMTLVFR
ncbi:MAG: flagellar biosynthesis protein FliR [Frankiaceae bacterium]|nr:flagellar biosynthesis protein FliR [Frankiaceae bacterium]